MPWKICVDDVCELFVLPFCIILDKKFGVVVTGISVTVGEWLSLGAPFVVSGIIWCNPLA